MKKPKFKKVLVVDDSPQAVKLLEATLQKMKCNVDSSSSPTEILKKMTQNEYDLIVLDWVMPQMNGRQTLLESEKILKKVKNHLKNRSVVIFSSMALKDMALPECEFFFVNGVIDKNKNLHEIMRSLSVFI